MLHKLPGYEIICEIKSRHHVQDMRPGVSRLNTLSQVDRIGIPFFWTARTPSPRQNYVTESQIRCPDRETCPEIRCSIVSLPSSSQGAQLSSCPEGNGSDLEKTICWTNKHCLTWYQWQLTRMIWWQCNLGEWIKPALGLGVATSIIWLADTSSFFTNQRWYIFK